MKECPACKHCFLDEFTNCPNDGEVLRRSIDGDLVLDRRYTLERRLGQGGMGIVYKARHVFLKTPCAIKIILPDLVGNDPMLVTRFRQEAMVAARIRHRNIVNVVDFGVERTMPYLVMDFIQGRSLHDILAEQGRLTPERALEIMEAVCAGVGAAHDQGIVHRDLKPLNIMLQDDTRVSEGVKVLDFGLAKIKSGEFLGSFIAAQTSGLMGSPLYMAPELWSDEEPDRCADIYSLGVILFQILAGDVPFKGPSIPSIMKKHLTESPPSLAAMGLRVPPEIDAVVRHAMAKKRENRLASVEEFTSELRTAVFSSGANLRYRSMESMRDSRSETLPAIRANESQEATVPTPTGGDLQEISNLSDSQRHTDDEADSLIREFEEAQRRADQARKRAEEATRRRAEEEAARKRAEAEAARKLEEEKAAQRRAQEAARKLAEEEVARKRADDEAARLRAEEEARKRAEEELARKQAAEEAARLASEVAELQRRAEEARLRAEDEARRRNEEVVARRRAEQEAERLTSEVAAAKQRAEESRQRAEEEAEKRAKEELARKQVEEAVERERAASVAKMRAEEEVARKRASEEAERLAREVADARQRADQARQRAEEESRKRIEEEAARKRAEAEARKLAVEVADAQRRAEEVRKRAEEEARRQAEARAQSKREEEERAAEAQRSHAARMERDRAKLSEFTIPETQTLPRPDREPEPQETIISHSGGNDIASDKYQKTLALQGRATTNTAATSWPQIQPGASSPDIEVKPKRKSVMLIVVGSLLVFAVIGAGIVVALYAWHGQGTTPVVTVNANSNANAKAQASPPTAPAITSMVKVEGGNFLMGRNDVNVQSGLLYDMSQYPAHQVPVKTFWMDKTEVTNEEYADFVRLTKHLAPSDWPQGVPPPGRLQWPVTQVSLTDANAFAEWRSRRDHRKYRLPTEEEWEYAARNGSRDSLYPWGNEWLDEHANVDGKSLKTVASYPQGASLRFPGLMDLIGNAWEWTSSKATAYQGSYPKTDIPLEKIIIRGGGFKEPSHGAEAVTATRRSWLSASAKDNSVGFRLVLEEP